MNFKASILLVFLFSILVSCDSGLKWNNPIDPESKTYQACEGSEEGKSRCFNAYSIQICKNGSWQYPQNCQKYEYCDEGKGECTAKDACTENPCAKILHSDGDCKTTEDGFECGCEGNYSWKEGLCAKNTSELCNLCGDIEHATGQCPTDEDGNYFCECETNYGWDSQNRECIGEIVTSNCTGLPEYALWNTTDTITQTWNGEAWVPSRKGEYNETPSETECRFICDDTHHWENILCRSNTQNIPCEGLPEHASWNESKGITQTWNGSGWEPSTTGQFSEDACTDRCCFKCNENFNWNSSTSACDAATRVAECTDLPENASWNSVSEITQTWNAAGWWEPLSIAEYSEDNYSTDRCYFQCNTNYEWNFSEWACYPGTRAADCSPKPENSTWNDYYSGKFIQTWNGSEWEPASYTSTHGATTATCHFVCDMDYHWNGSQCVFCDTSSGSYYWNTSGQCINALECSPNKTSLCIDSESGLFWSASSSELLLAAMTWQEAVEYCGNLTEGGYTDWKLPTIDELRTLIQNCPTSQSGGDCPATDPGCLDSSCWSEELCKCNEDGISYSKFADTGILWSSSTKTPDGYADTESAWAVLFEWADVDIVSKTTKNSVRCVR